MAENDDAIESSVSERLKRLESASAPRVTAAASAPHVATGATSAAAGEPLAPRAATASPPRAASTGSNAPRRLHTSHFKSQAVMIEMPEMTATEHNFARYIKLTCLVVIAL